jgi:hypothetical protein
MSTERLPESDGEKNARRAAAARQLRRWLGPMLAISFWTTISLQYPKFRDDPRVLGPLLAIAVLPPLIDRWMSSKHRTKAATGTAAATRHRHRTGRGQKPMIWLAGAVLVTFAIANEVRAQGIEHGPLWRMFAGIAAFLYLWWLSSLLFDLLFVWHRYIQGDAAHRFLREHVQKKSFSPRDDPPMEPPPPAPAVIPPLRPSGGSPAREQMR